MKKIIFIVLILSILSIENAVKAQTQTKLDLALRSLEQSRPQFGLSEKDISDLAISDQYVTDHNGLTHFYFIQRFKGIEIYNAITSVHVAKDGKVYDSPNRFYDNITSKINTTRPSIDAKDALIKLISYYNIPNAILPTNTSRSAEGKMQFSKTNFTHNDIPVKLMYQENAKGELRLAWDLELDLLHENNYWSTRVDAVTGEVLHKHNYTISCSFSKKTDHSCNDHRAPKENAVFMPVKKALADLHTTQAVESYNVYALPLPNPLYGSRSLQINPADAIASPFGWHDTNGIPGPEFTITKGNNVHAYLDRVPDNFSDGAEPNGDAALNFDFPLNINDEPSQYISASITNLFYINNMMHDITYHYGFNEVAGNFQFKNYLNTGRGNDHVVAEAQDGSGVNNANFATPADGGNGRMQMFLWTAAHLETHIIAPDTIVGFLNARRGNFGPAPSDIPLDAEVAIANDYSPTPTLGCRNTFRRQDIEGKIVLIDRGTCQFGTKTLYAQNGGAAGVIICNFEDSFVSMDGGTDGGQVTIPAYFTTKSICDRLKIYVGKGLKIRIQAPQGNNVGPDSLDADLDNEIIAHEYGHGISNRLTGGPAAAGCLGNAEQMGEGWSDFFALIVTPQPNAKGTDSRGIGTYSNSDKASGIGIRRKFYNTDLNVNNFTYKDIDIEEHNLGEIWTLVLWDLYWALADKYGYDPNLKNKTAGNNIGIQLVMDGMKLQPCSPGFIDGRNAILKADSINNSGTNSCLIWEIFARRGMGFFAKQGLSNMVFDETESFIPFLTCVNKISLLKRAGEYNAKKEFIKQDIVKAGEEITYTLELNNYKAGASNNVVLIDQLADGTSYVAGSANITPVIDGTTLSWTFPTLKSLENITIKYRVTTNPNRFSTTLLYDDLNDPNTEDLWETDVFKGITIWGLGPLGVDQTQAWTIDEASGYSNDAHLSRLGTFKLSGNDPSVMFYHYFDTERSFDAGILEISTDGGNFYQPITKDEFSLNPYNSSLNYQAFVIPNLDGFSGYSKEFIPSVVSLSKYNGQDVRIRFRSAFDSLNIGTGGGGFNGWIIDNFEYIDPIFYNSEACLTSAEADFVCSKVEGKGTLADSKKVVKTKNIAEGDNAIKVYPNPSRGEFLISLHPNDEIHSLLINLPTGQLLKEYKVGPNQNTFRISTEGLPKTFITIQAIGKNKTYTAKVIIQ